jgi:osmotically-inducible protein OsmY
MTYLLLVAIGIALSGCTTALLVAYDVATDERSIEAQASDAGIGNTIRGELLEAGLQKFHAVDVHCHRGVVLLAGVVEPGNDAGVRAVAIARRTDGVRRVQTYFLPSRASSLDDIEIGARFLSRIALDTDLRVAQVDFSVINGHVVLAGVVDGRPRIQAIVRHARAVEGVKVVKSYLQLKGS